VYVVWFCLFTLSLSLSLFLGVGWKSGRRQAQNSHLYYSFCMYRKRQPLSLTWKCVHKLSRHSFPFGNFTSGNERTDRQFEWCLPFHVIWNWSVPTRIRQGAGAGNGKEITCKMYKSSHILLPSVRKVLFIHDIITQLSFISVKAQEAQRKKT
jgi:hypothetical protein